jgi:alpha-ketoglutarate-dependent taurine dioxygenase
MLDERGFSIVPEHADDPGEAARLMKQFGAAILTGLGTTQEVAATLARTVFGEDVVAAPPPVSVREGGEKDRKVREVAPNEIALPIHTDGFAYGNLMPDAIFLLCVKGSSEGGESVLIDNLAVIDALADGAAGPVGRQLSDFASHVTLDLTEPGMRRRQGTIVATTSSGRRRCWLGRGVPGMPTPLPDDPQSAMHAEQWKELDAVWDNLHGRAQRFRLKPGEALCIDNFRVAHSRDPYTDLDRLMWRVWAWTTTAMGVPEGELASDTRYATTAPSA